MVSKWIGNERGFTLMEMLVVLAIFMVISSSLLFVTTEKLTNYTNEQFIDHTEVLIRLAQVRAMETNSRYEISVFGCRRLVVRHHANTTEILHDQPFPEGIKVFIETSSDKITFRPNGNISTAGSITYYLNDSYYDYSVNIGKGRLILKSVGTVSEGMGAC